MPIYRTSLFLAAIVAVTIVGTDACTQNFKRAADITNFTKECFAKMGLGEPPKPEDIGKPDFDDKCASKCIMRSLELIDDGGHVDRDALADFIEDNADKPAVIKITEIATSCADSAEADKVTGTKDGNTPAECKPISNFYGCFLAATAKLC